MQVVYCCTVTHYSQKKRIQTMSSSRSDTATNQRLFFDGNEDKYEIWEVKFLAHLRKLSLITAIEDKVNENGEPSPVDPVQNANVFAELVQYLDDKSIQLIMKDAKDDGNKALKILRKHYKGSANRMLISGLYNDLTSLKMSSDEEVGDYLYRAEKIASSLKITGEVVNDRLLISAVLRGLPQEFDIFTSVATEEDRTQTFDEFKDLLTSFEELEKTRAATSQQSATRKKAITCYTCGKPGHKSFQCRINVNYAGKYKLNKMSFAFLNSSFGENYYTKCPF